jgi:hypothetical protein
MLAADEPKDFALYFGLLGLHAWKVMSCRLADKPWTSEIGLGEMARNILKLRLLLLPFVGANQGQAFGTAAP